MNDVTGTKNSKVIIDTIKEMMIVGLSNNFIVKEISVMFNIDEEASKSFLQKVN